VGEAVLDYFAALKKSGNYIPVGTTSATVASGQTPISLDWDYNNLAYVKEFPAARWKVVVPSDGVYGGYYAQGVVKGSPHQNCAKLWLEHILSDEGALGYIQGGAMHDAEGHFSHRAMWILLGGLLGTIMWFNVWFVIWPNQQKAMNIDNKYPDLTAEAKAASAKTAGMFSRVNTMLSIPMLFAMVSAGHLY